MALDGLFELAVGHVTRHVLDQAFLGTVIKHLLPQGARSVEVLGHDGGEEGHSFTDELAVDFVEVNNPVLELDGFDGGQIVGTGALIIEGHVAIALEVGHLVGRPAGVDRQLLVVDADTVAMGIRIGKETGLKDGIGGGLDTRHEMGGVESNLLDLGEVVDSILIENELSDLPTRELALRPDMSQVEDIDSLLFP